MIRRLLPLLAVFLIASSCDCKPPDVPPVRPPPILTGTAVTLRDQRLLVEWVRTDPERMEQLAGHAALGESGLLIGYAHDRILYHHTQQGGPACDIAWLNKDRRIFELAALPRDHEEGVTSRGEGRYALAAPPGWLKKVGAAIGDIVTFSDDIAAAPPSELPEIKVGPVAVRVEVSEHSGERMRGLMHRRRMSGHDGMLFIYSYASGHSFWMGNCHYPLDIAYFDGDGRFLNVCAAMTYPDPKVDDGGRAPSAGDAKYVLEVNLGWFKANGLVDAAGKAIKEIVLTLPDEVKKLAEQADP